MDRSGMGMVSKLLPEKAVALHTSPPLPEALITRRHLLSSGPGGGEVWLDGRKETSSWAKAGGRRRPRLASGGRSSLRTNRLVAEKRVRTDRSTSQELQELVEALHAWVRSSDQVRCLSQNGLSGRRGRQSPEDRRKDGSYFTGLSVSL